MYLVTGANGFIGRHACTAATAPFRALLHSPDPRFSARFPLAEVVIGDLLDPAVLAQALHGAQGVLHLAARNVDTTGEGYTRVNVTGLAAMLDAAETAGVRRVVAISSTGVLGHHTHRGADEQTPLAPDTPFSRSKAQAETLLLERHRAGRLQATILRHRFVYGDGDQAVLPRMHRALTRSPVWVGSGKARLSLVWAGDLATVAWRLLTAPEPRAHDPIYHLTDGEPHALADIGAALCDLLGGSLPRLGLPFWLVHGALRARERLAGIDPETAHGTTSLRVALVGQDNWFSDARLRQRLPDFTPTPLDQGLRNSADWYRARCVDTPTG